MLRKITIISLIIYLTGALICASFDVTKWNVIIRGFAGFFLIVGIVCVWLFKKMEE